MNIENFDELFPEHILDRGFDYYKSGNIKKIERVDNSWLAKVEGNYGNYKVRISVDQNSNIKTYQCNCPYDGGACKHIAAVFYYIDENEDDLVTENTTIGNSEWENIIKNLPEEDLRSFISNYAKDHIDLQNDLIIQFTQISKNINIEKYRAMLSNHFDDFSDYGMIHYRDVYGAVALADTLLNNAETHIENKNYYEAFSMLAAVAPECLDALQMMDDSDGYCGGTIDKSFLMAQEVINKCNDEELSELIFDWLYESVNNSDYDNYGCAEELLPIFFELANTPKRILKAHQFVDQQIKTAKNDDGWSAKYKLKNAILYKIDLLKKESKPKEIEILIDENLHLSDLLQIRIDEAIENKDTNRAIELINKGIKQAQTDRLAGVENDFKKQLLGIFQILKDDKNIRALALDLYYNGRETMKYYRIYKNTIPKEDWETYRDQIIKNHLKEYNNHYFGSQFRLNLAEIYKEEKMIDALFKEVKKAQSINIIEKYQNLLKQNYSDEIIQIYAEAIEKTAMNTGRSVYVEIAGYLKKLSKLNSGHEAAVLLSNELLEKYNNRPAMKEEFGKLPWIKNK